MWTLVGWTEAQDSAVLVPIAALADQSVRVNGDDIIVPRQVANLMGVYALGPSLTRAQLASPSIRRRYPIEVVPLDVGAEPATPYPFYPYPLSPIGLDAEEALNSFMAEDGATTRGTVLAWLSDGPVSPVDGMEVFTIRATNATTLVANAWTNGALTMNDTLPAGRYGIVGMYATSAGLQAARLVIPEYQWRPGVIGGDAVSDQVHALFRNGGLGIWGEFEHNTPPTVDFLSNSADTSQVVELDLVMLEGRLSGPGRA